VLPAFGTIVAKRELPYARVLGRSLAVHHPGNPFLVLLTDEVQGCFDPKREPFELLTLDDLEIPAAARFRFLHRRQPLSYAATPYFLSGLLDRGRGAVVFLKQESLVMSAQRSVLEALGAHSIVLTPHLLEPPRTGDARERELNILLSGTFNGGVVGVRETETARRFLTWWADRVFSSCRHAVGEGMHYEQRWLDLVPAYFRDTRVLRDGGANIGHWNLPERLEAPPELLRFSGFDPDRPEQVTRYTQRLATADLDGLSSRFADYAQALHTEGWAKAQRWPYAYDSFANGVPVPELARDLYAELGPAAERFGDPFETGAGTFYAWLNERVLPPRGVTRLWSAVHGLRGDLQAAFPDPLGTDHDAFLDWTRTSGASEHGVHLAFLPGGGRE
jgi:hypothetical protein